MSTFFEKLTGQQPKKTPSDTIDLASAKEDQKKRPRSYAPPDERKPQSTHLRVATEDTEENSAEKPELPEEEGELTVDIFDKGDSIVIQSTVAGVKPEDLDVSITSDSVTIRGRREQEQNGGDEHYYYKELFWGVFSRSVILPEEIEDDTAEASLKHGLLTIKLPKKRRGVVQKLKVKMT